MKLRIYKHYKGQKYEVLGLVRHSETLEEMVLYKALYEINNFKENPLFVRPKKMFEEEIIIDNKKIKRYQLIK